MIERGLWHPVIAATEVGDAPVAVTLLGQPLVLWRAHAHGTGGGASVLHAWADRCPHRGARLSLGRVLEHVHGARLECPYHGWQFAAGGGQGGAEGRCVHVPAAPAFEPPASHAVTAYEVRERHGLVWVRLQRPADALLPTPLHDVPAFAPWDEAGWRRLLCGPYEVAASAPRLVENFLDLSHFGFVHEGWLGARTHAEVDTGRVDERAEGVVAESCRAWQPRAYASAEGGAWIAYRYEVPHPYAAILRKDAAEGDPISNAIALFIKPEDDERCVAWFATATRGDESDDAQLRAFQDAVFAQDQPIVESQWPRRLPIGREHRVREVHGPADRMSSAYRRYLARLGITLGTC
jgi:phenylpropionate dioxygenase-like ring-hydroxylating dioxygenase large terminal subunit